MIRLEDACAAALQRTADRPAIEFQGRWYGWGELRQTASAVQSMLDRHGIAPGETIALIPRNRPSALAALLGLIAQARNLRMIYAFQSDRAMARDIEQLRAAAVIGDVEDFGEAVMQALRASGGAGIALDGMTVIEKVGPDGSSRRTTAATAPRIEILTSGTTGAPKPFAIGYELIARHYLGGASLGDDECLALAPSLLFFPLGNISGIYASLPVLIRGQRCTLLERFTVAGWHQHLLRYRPAVSGLPPAGVQMVLDAAIPPEDLSCIKRLGTGAAPLDPTVHRAFEQRYGVPILLSYGATEFGGPVTAMTPELHAEWGRKKFGSVGRALPGAQLRVIDTDSGEVLPPGCEGLLEVTTPRMGPTWIRTSDIALIDEDGFLFHRGRADGAIMRGGFKLLPETIERALLQHPAVSAAAVIGLNDARLGQVPAAVVQFKPGIAAPDVTTLAAHLRDSIFATHIPAHWRFVEELPRTPTLKVDRRGLLALFERG